MCIELAALCSGYGELGARGCRLSPIALPHLPSSLGATGNGIEGPVDVRRNTLRLWARPRRRCCSCDGQCGVMGMYCRRGRARPCCISCAVCGARSDRCTLACGRCSSPCSLRTSRWRSTAFVGPGVVPRRGGVQSVACRRGVRTRPRSSGAESRAAPSAESGGRRCPTGPFAIYSCTAVAGGRPGAGCFGSA